MAAQCSLIPCEERPAWLIFDAGLDILLVIAMDLEFGSACGC